MFQSSVLCSGANLNPWHLCQDYLLKDIDGLHSRIYSDVLGKQDSVYLKYWIVLGFLKKIWNPKCRKMIFHDSPGWITLSLKNEKRVFKVWGRLLKLNIWKEKSVVPIGPKKRGGIMKNSRLHQLWISLKTFLQPWEAAADLFRSVAWLRTFPEVWKPQRNKMNPANAWNSKTSGGI